MNAGAALVIGILLVFAGINGFSYYLFWRLKNLVLQTGDEIGDLVMGDEVAHVFTKYLFAELMAGRFYDGRSSVKVIGDPESDEVIQSVRQSEEYWRIRQLARYVRNVPGNCVPYVV
jgi:hypothetical protein